MFNFLKNINIKTRLILLIVIPTVVILLFASVAVKLQYETSASMSKMYDASMLSTKISSLVHETQKERGLTAGFMASLGNKFASELNSQRELTDKALLDIKNYLQIIYFSDISKDSNEIIQKALVNLDEVKQIRNNIDNLTIKSSNAISYYTNINSLLLNTIVNIVKVSDNPVITKDLIAFSNFLLSKERAGIERATGASTFTADKFKNGTRTKLNSLISAQDSYMSGFLLYSSEQTKKYYNNKMKNNAVREVDKMRAVMLDANEIGGFGIDSNIWFMSLTKKINLLKNIEDYILKELRVKDKSLIKRVKVIKAISSLLHETQKERGATAGYLGSKGKKFGNELENQRKLTTLKIAKLEVLIKNSNENLLNENSKKILSKAFKSLDVIKTKRNNIDDFSIKTKNAITYYSNLNAVLLQSVSSIVSTATSINSSKDLTAFYSFIMAKEKAGIERAVGTNAFARNKFLPGMKDKFVSLITEQESYMTLFNAIANPDYLAYYKQTLDQNLIDKIEKMRAIARNANTIGGFGISASYWISTITKKINLLKNVDDFLAKNLINKVSELKTAAIQNFTFYFTLALVSIFISMLFGILTNKNISKSLKSLNNGILNLINNSNTSTNKIELDSNDEIKNIADNFNLYIEKIEEGLKQDQKVIAEVNDVVTKVKSGFFSYTIKQNANNEGINELKNSMNEMIFDLNNKLNKVIEALL